MQGKLPGILGVLANKSLGVRRQDTEGSTVASEVSSSSVSSSQPSQGVSSVSSTSSNRSDVSERTWQRRTNCVLKGLLSLDEFGQHKLLSKSDVKAVLMHHGRKK